MLSAFHCGGNWHYGANCGGRAVSLNDYPWNVNTDIGSRLACDELKRIPSVFIDTVSLRSAVQW
jgi:hypothetical protein